MLAKFVSDFRYIAPFRNGRLEGEWCRNAHFLTPSSVKIRGGGCMSIKIEPQSAGFLRPCDIPNSWTPAGFFPGVGKFIGVAGIFSVDALRPSKNCENNVEIIGLLSVRLTSNAQNALQLFQGRGQVPSLKSLPTPAGARGLYSSRWFFELPILRQ